jgi:hypothetical protein
VNEKNTPESMMKLEGLKNLTNHVSNESLVVRNTSRVLAKFLVYSLRVSWN